MRRLRGQVDGVKLGSMKGIGGKEFFIIISLGHELHLL